MKNRLLLTIISCALALFVNAQVGTYENNMPIDEHGNLTTNGNIFHNDSTKQKEAEMPIGMHVWTINRFGDVISATPDTLPHTYRASIFTSGREGQFNTLGNSGTPRQNRIFTDRNTWNDFIFIHPYDYFVENPLDFHFTNTYSPITNLSYNSCGDKLNGEDNLRALFATNINKQWGLGFKFNYLYARGYYQNQATSHFQFSPWVSYLGDRYEMHFLFSTNNQKVTENGGILDDDYITHPEKFSSFEENEIPTALSQTWNRNKNQHIFFTQRYKIGFKKKVPMTEDEIKAKKFAIESQRQQKEKEEIEKRRKEGANPDEVVAKGRPKDAKIAGDLPTIGTKIDDRITINQDSIDSLKNTANIHTDTVWTKDEFVPVTSFIHTLDWNFYDRIFQAYTTPMDYYLNMPRYQEMTDSIFDSTQHYNIKNTFAISLLEGFNKYAKAGLKLFASHELRHYALPDETAHQKSFNESDIRFGAQISKTQGIAVHYDVLGEFAVAGDQSGAFNLEGHGDLNFHLWGDTIQLAAHVKVENNLPSFYYRHYGSKYFTWENNLDKEFHTKVEGIFSLKRTHTRLRFAMDNISNYTYLTQTYSLAESARTATNIQVEQESNNINIMTLQLMQNFKWGILNWENILTMQTTSDKNILPLPLLNIYSNLYINFNIRKILDVDFGFDVTYFTEYDAPDYSPTLGSYTVQANEERVTIGNYPWINIYADFFLKHARFFVMYSHANTGMFNKRYFLTPHYPTNSAVLRFGVSWNFFN